MMKKADLEKLLAGEGSDVTKKYGYLVDCITELYETGMTLKHLDKMFPVSKMWIKNRLIEAGVELRERGPRVMEDRQALTADLVIKILKSHDLSLEKLSKLKPVR